VSKYLMTSICPVVAFSIAQFKQFQTYYNYSHSFPIHNFPIQDNKQHPITIQSKTKKKEGKTNTKQQISDDINKRKQYKQFNICYHFNMLIIFVSGSS